MKRLIAPIVIGTLAWAAALPAAAQVKTNSVGMAASHDPAAERTSYTQKAQAEMHLWEQRLHDFNARIENRTTQSQSSAARDLDGAWSDTKIAWNQLETAGENDWTSAKASFQGASHKLGVTWQRVSSKEK